MSTAPSTARQILNLAIPALATLIAEPLFTVIDSAMIGHLGTAQLAGLSVGAQILNTFIILFIFLAYSTTSLAARALGQGRTDKALRSGIDAIWLATALGIPSAVLLALAGPRVVQLMGISGQATPHALAYLWSSAPGLLGMFVVMAAVGTLRGLQDTRTPLIVTIAGAAFNVVANALFIYGLGWGVAGSGLGTSVTQLLMAAYLASRLGRAARREGVSLRPSGSGVWAAARQGSPLIIRGLMLRLAGLATLWPVAASGTAPLAGYQVALTVWSFSAYMLDALAIAAQAMVGKSLGKGNLHETRELLSTLAKWGIYAGILTGLVVGVASSWLPLAFGTDPAMHQAATWGLIAGCIGMPLAGVVFTLDGVLLGAGHNTYFAWAGVIQFVVLLPALGAVEWWRLSGAPPHMVVGTAWLAYSLVYLGVRLATNAWRTWYSPAHALIPRA